MFLETASTLVPDRSLRSPAPQSGRASRSGAGTHPPNPLALAVATSGPLTVARADDPAEHEAKRIAAGVDSGGSAGRETCACGGTPGADGECSACRAARLGVQRSPAAQAGSSTAPPIVHDVISSAGRPLDPGTRAAMEQRLGHDFGGVRVHTDARAAESARAVGATAYTVGESIAFGAGRYAPSAAEGRRLLAHELVHTVQQRGAGAPALQRAPAAKTTYVDCTSDDEKHYELYKKKAIEILNTAISVLSRRPLSPKAETILRTLLLHVPDAAGVNGIKDRFKLALKLEGAPFKCEPPEQENCKKKDFAFTRPGEGGSEYIHVCGHDRIEARGIIHEAMHLYGGLPDTPTGAKGAAYFGGGCVESASTKPLTAHQRLYHADTITCVAILLAEAANKKGANMKPTIFDRR